MHKIPKRMESQRGVFLMTGILKLNSFSPPLLKKMSVFLLKRKSTPAITRIPMRPYFGFVNLPFRPKTGYARTPTYVASYRGCG